MFIPLAAFSGSHDSCIVWCAGSAVETLGCAGGAQGPPGTGMGEAAEAPARLAPFRIFAKLLPDHRGFFRAVWTPCGL